MMFHLRKGLLTSLAAMSPPSGYVPPAGIGTWSLDFMGEVYTRNGSTVAIADIIDKPARVGASGLEILDNDPDGTVAAIGALLTDLLLLDWTIIIEWEEVAGGVGDIPLLISMLETATSTSCFIYRNTPAAYVRVADSGAIVRDLHVTGTFGLGTHKVAVTRTNNFLSASVDGSSVETNTNHLTLDLTDAAFGGDPGGDSWAPCFIRSISLTAPVADAALPGLSA